jgi:hypothetical protein
VGKVLAVAALVLAVVCAPLLVALMVAGAAGSAAGNASSVCGGAVPATGTWRPPFVQAYTLSPRGIGWRYHPVFKRMNFHGGQDMSSQPGPGPIVAVTSGRVVRAGWDTTGYGNVVDLQHAGGIQTRYAHLATIDPAIAAGATVAVGQQLGVEGSTGASTGNHLHFEVIADGERVDPIGFMRSHGAPLDGRAVGPSGAVAAGPREAVPSDESNAPLPPPGQPRRNSLHNPPQPIPEDILRLYIEAGWKYGIPWQLLAGIGMEETAHGRITGVSSAGARGVMQFMPATWASFGVDGDGDRRADINNKADSIHSAANYLDHTGARTGADGVRRALLAYNHADWYVNDVLYYAEAYGSGRLPAASARCPALGDRETPMSAS